MMEWMKVLHIILSLILFSLIIAIIITRNVYGFIYFAFFIAIIDLYIAWRATS